MKFSRSTSRALAWTLLIAGGLVACSKVPITGRRQFNLLPESLMNSLGESTYSSMLADVTISRGNDNAKTLQKLGGRIADASGVDYDWEFKLIQDSDTINAWALPGGKAAVYTGLLPVVQNEAGLAFVVGHEVGHATAHHGAERVSQQLAALGGLVGLYLYLDNKSEMSDEARGLLVAALGLGVEVGVLLPFSRSHEKEADVIGMMYMAKAGYPPAESLAVWSRMDEATGGSALPEYLSTHPDPDSRKENLQEWMSKARKRYERHALNYDTTKTLWTSNSAGSSKGRSDRGSTAKGKSKSEGGEGKSGSGGSERERSR